MTNILYYLQSFSMLTTAIDTTLQVSIHVVFQLFSWLFDQIEKIEKNLKKKREKEKTKLLETLNIAKKKLIIYYEKTFNIYDYFFNLATILNPSIKKILYQISFSYRLITIIYHKYITYSLL